MRRLMVAAVLAMALAACGKKEEESQRAADARAKAAGFVPPSVTSRVDFGGAMDRRFRSLDRDGNNEITADEMPVRYKQRLMELDRNHDGRVSEIEFSEGTLKHFDQYDLNHDGTVTSEERHTARTETRSGG